MGKKKKGVQMVPGTGKRGKKKKRSCFHETLVLLSPWLEERKGPLLTRLQKKEKKKKGKNPSPSPEKDKRNVSGRVEKKKKSSSPKSLKVSGGKKKNRTAFPSLGMEKRTSI